MCNIGPAEIARRRRAGHVGVVASLGLLGILVVIDAPDVTRVLVAVPLALAASGYLQARSKFCAGFGSRGVFNFGALGETHEVADSMARRQDRARATQIGVASVAIGIVGGVAVALLPI